MVSYRVNLLRRLKYTLRVLILIVVDNGLVLDGVEGARTINCKS